MLKHKFVVRPGFSVILNADNSNDPKADVYRAGDELQLTPAQLLAHRHKVQATDSESQKALDGLDDGIHPSAADINQNPNRRHV